MKKNIISIALAGIFFAFALKASAQKDSSGIYQTANDFKNQKLSYAINYKTEKHRINDNLFLNETQIRVRHHDSTYMLEKSNTYGYKNTRGDVFRLVDNKELKILNPGEQILIYHFETNLPQPKNTPFVVVKYFFTRDAANPPVELTKENLKKAFPDNHMFHDALDENFKTDDDLMSYDKFHKMYKINWLLQGSMK